VIAVKRAKFLLLAMKVLFVGVKIESWPRVRCVSIKNRSPNRGCVLLFSRCRCILFCCPHVCVLLLAWAFDGLSFFGIASVMKSALERSRLARLRFNFVTDGDGDRNRIRLLEWIAFKFLCSYNVNHHTEIDCSFDLMSRPFIVACEKCIGTGHRSLDCGAILWVLEMETGIVFGCLRLEWIGFEFLYSYNVYHTL